MTTSHLNLLRITQPVGKLNFRKKHPLHPEPYLRTLPQMSEKIRENNQLENKSEPFSDISLSDDQGKDAEQTLKALKIELSIMPKIRNIEQEIDKSQKQLECLDLLKDEPTILNKTRKNLTNFREDLKKLNNTYTGLHLKPKE